MSWPAIRRSDAARGARIRTTWVIALALFVALPGVARAQSPSRTADGGSEQRAAVQTRLRSLFPDAAVPRTAWTDDGALHYLAAPAGVAIKAPRREPGRPEVAALAFLADHSVLFGTSDASLGFQLERRRDRGERRFVRTQQTAHGIPVFGGEMIVQLDRSDGVQAVIGNVARGAFPMSAGQASPTLSAVEASAAARERAMRLGVSAKLEVGEASLVWFVPQVLREEGLTKLAWSVLVRDPASPTFDYRWLLDARDASLVREFPLTCTAIARRIYDMASDTLNNPIPLVRTEGGPATGIADVDDAYDQAGDTYNFYWTRHARDGVNGAGAIHHIAVRVCTGGADPHCPWGNASGGSSSMSFGLGMVEDDVLAHEWTHGVTNWESALIYANESGSINESLSDVWGEFVDLTNGRGNDAANVRWKMGEDLTGGALLGPIRDMKTPTLFGDPDRRYSPNYYVGSDEDYEVHTNSGVNNKLCYLLTDGATFNGRTVYGMGIDAVADLYYEAQTDLLVSSSGWALLSAALQQSAVNLGWNDADQLNLYRGLLAVEIATPQDLWVDAASLCFFPNGSPICSFFEAPYPDVLTGHSMAHPGDILHIRSGTYPGAHTLTKPMTLRAEGGVVTIGP